MKKKTIETKKLVVTQQTIRALDKKETLAGLAGGRFPYSAASHQDVCCA